MHTSNVRWFPSGLAGILVASACAFGASSPLPRDRPTTFSLSDSEKAWVKDHPKLRVGFSSAYAPYSMPIGHGKMEGIDIDYLGLISKRTGIEFETVIFPTWPEVTREFKAGHIDVLTGLGRSKTDEDQVIFAGPYLLVPHVIVTRTDQPYLLQASDLRGVRVGVAKGYLVSGSLVEAMLSDSIVVPFDSEQDVLKALSRGLIDATLDDSVNAAYVIKSLHLTNLRLGSAIDNPSGNYFGLRTELRVAAEMIDRAVSTITTDERRAIDDRWIVADTQPNRWLLAFKVAAAVAAASMIVFLLVYAHNRKLRSELNERLRVQRELEDTHLRLAKAIEQKTALLRMVAHDIRSPLTGILLAADFAPGLDPSDEANLKALLGEIRASAVHLSHLVEDVLDAQASEDGDRVYQREEIDCAVLAKEAVAAHAKAALRKEISVKLTLGAPTLRFQTDPSAFRQVADNLLSNAIKYTRPGSTVGLSLVLSEKGLRLAVSDEGPGISPTDRDRIFLRYGKGAATPTGQEKSTGLGLWIVDRIVAGLRGDVHCESDLGHGSTFVVNLPHA